VSPNQDDAVIEDLARMTTDFFRAVSFSQGAKPAYVDIFGLFIDSHQEKGLPSGRRASL
jgi:hypothetical protein